MIRTLSVFRLGEAVKYGKYRKGGVLNLDRLFCQLPGDMGIQIGIVIVYACLGYSIGLRWQVAGKNEQLVFIKTQGLGNFPQDRRRGETLVLLYAPQI